MARIDWTALFKAATSVLADFLGCLCVVWVLFLMLLAAHVFQP